MSDRFVAGEPDKINKWDNILWLRAEIERLTAQLKATEANEQVLVDANKPLLERIAKLEAAISQATRHINAGVWRATVREELLEAIAEVK